MPPTTDILSHSKKQQRANPSVCPLSLNVYYLNMKPANLHYQQIKKMNRFLSCIAKQFNPYNHVDNKKVYRLNRRHRFSSCTAKPYSVITLAKTTRTAKSFNFNPSTFNVQCSPQNFRTPSPSEHQNNPPLISQL